MESKRKTLNNHVLATTIALPAEARDETPTEFRRVGEKW